MTLPKTTLDREFQKFRDTGEINKTKVAVNIEQDASSPIPVYLTDSVGEISIIEFDEISNVAQNILSDVLVYTVPIGKTLRLKSISFSGDNVAKFSVLVDNVLKEIVRIWHTDFNRESLYDITFSENTELKVKVIHERSSNGSFSSTLKGELL